VAWPTKGLGGQADGWVAKQRVGLLSRDGWLGTVKYGWLIWKRLLVMAALWVRIYSRHMQNIVNVRHTKVANTLQPTKN
jgi:hypothetical protein